MAVTYVLFPDGGFTVGCDTTGRTGYAAPGSEWAERARTDPEGVAAEMIENVGPASSADRRGSRNRN